MKFKTTFDASSFFLGLMTFNIGLVAALGSPGFLMGAGLIVMALTVTSDTKPSAIDTTGLGPLGLD